MSNQKKNKKICLGLLAHVDAGKTTLSEALLYQAGIIKKPGRVDNKDAYLDTNAMERERGITIFSKLAEFSYENLDVTLLDTPGHVDFSAEMERTLQVLDYAILIINGADGVQAHTRTLWNLLKRYDLLVFLFVNKMDQTGTDKDHLLNNLQKELSGNCVDFSNPAGAEFAENIAMCEDALLEDFLQTGVVEKESIVRLIWERKLFPVFFGSALKIQGVKELMEGLCLYTGETVYPGEFGARVFKIMRDEQGNRLSFLKITGGSLKVREQLGEEKISQIRRYSGDKFETINEAKAGEICAVMGLSGTYPGEGLGAEGAEQVPLLEPVLNYQVILPPEVDALQMMPKLRLLEEEDPKLHVIYDEAVKEIQVHIMGEVQLEILQRQIKDRFGIVAEFAKGSVIYKETIANPVLGVGHFEPLRHYAEVQILMEPGEVGSGLCFARNCSVDILAENWQRLILTHLEEKEHKGVLTGSQLTDVKITLVAGRAHQKHTEGGDFRQATYRAVRQGLMEAESVLLEPHYAFLLQVPESMIGRAMTDMERMHAQFEMPEMEAGVAVLRGHAPVVCLQGYQKEVLAYTKGLGSISLVLKGYYPSHNAEEIVQKYGYNPEEDFRNPTGSVFCAHGAGFVVPWDEVKDYKHVEAYVSLQDGIQVSYGDEKEDMEQVVERAKTAQKKINEMSLGTDEIDSILDRTYHANKKTEENRKGIYWKKEKRENAPVTTTYKPRVKRDEYLLVDGYNVIFAWDELREVADVNIDGARGKLQDILCDYQAIKGCEVIAVFDAYRVQGHDTEFFDYHNIHVVFTKEAETADRYIERFAHENNKKYNITVATSDGLEQIIIRGQGCQLLSARDFYDEVKRIREDFKETYMQKPVGGRRFLMDDFAHVVEELRGEELQDEPPGEEQQGDR